MRPSEGKRPSGGWARSWRLEGLAQTRTQRKFSPTAGLGLTAGVWAGRVAHMQFFARTHTHTHTHTQVRARMGRWMVDRKEINIREALGEGAQGTVSFCLFVTCVPSVKCGMCLLSVSSVCHVCPVSCWSRVPQVSSVTCVCVPQVCPVAVSVPVA